MEMAPKPMPEGLRKFLDGCEDHTEMNGSLDIKWSRSGLGFGEFYFWAGDDGVIHCSNEGMSKAFLKEVLGQLVDQAIMDMPSKLDSE